MCACVWLTIAESIASPAMRLKLVAVAAALAVAAAAAVVALAGRGRQAAKAPETDIPVVRAVAISKPLGPLPASRTVHLTVAVPGRERPAAPGLRVTWFEGETIAALDGPARAAESLFHVSLGQYVSPSGRTFYAANRTPALPVGIAGVTGLENWTR